MERRIDLHIHTKCSDGNYLPKEIIDMARKNNVKTIAIADHDTVDAYSNDLYEYANMNDIKIINAVEISSKCGLIGVHVLGYNIDINNQKLKDKLLKLRNARHEYLVNVALKLKSLGYVVNVSKLDKIDAVTKAHIAQDIIMNDENKEILLREFSHIPNKGEFIETIMNEGGCGYVKKEIITPKDAADLIKEAGGKVILAHPVAYKYEDGLSKNDIINLVKEIGADGIEVYYIYIDRNGKKINEIEEWKDVAFKYNLLETIGSDFHNDDGIHPEIGLNNELVDIDNEEIEKIINNLIDK